MNNSLPRDGDAPSADRWCVRSKDRWCASKSNRQHAAEAVNIATACGYFIVLPLGCERRQPSCAECVAALTADRKAEE